MITQNLWWSLLDNGLKIKLFWIHLRDKKLNSVNFVHETVIVALVLG